MAAPGSYRTKVGSQQLDLPLVPVGDDLTIALLITVDHGVSFAATAGRELAAELVPFQPDIVVSVATMGIPLAIEVTRSLGLDDYVILHKTPKIHLGESFAEPVRSITTSTPQTLRMDPNRVGAMRGRRVAVVDDIISTGASIVAALNLVRRVGALTGGHRHPHDGRIALADGPRRRCRQRPLPRHHAGVPRRSLGRIAARGVGLTGTPATGAVAHHPGVRWSGWSRPERSVSRSWWSWSMSSSTSSWWAGVVVPSSWWSWWWRSSGSLPGRCPTRHRMPPTG